MSNEYREYKGRKKRHSKGPSKKRTYLKKLGFQAIISSLILLFVFSPGLLGNKISAKVKSTAKSALSYKIDTENIYRIVAKALEKIAPDLYQGDFENEEILDTGKDI